MGLGFILPQRVVDTQLILRSKPAPTSFFDGALIRVNFVMKILSVWIVKR